MSNKNWFKFWRQLFCTKFLNFTFEMRKFITLFIILVFCSSFKLQNAKPVEEGIHWYSFTEAVELNKKNPKKIFIDVYTDWCGWCKVMDKSTFPNPVIVKLLNKNFYCVKLNAEMKDTVRFNNVTFINPNPTVSRSTHQLAASLLNNQLSYPTTVYLDENINMLQAIPGYQKPEQLEPILVFLGEGKYKTTSWDEFIKSYKGEIVPK